MQFAHCLHIVFAIRQYKELFSEEFSVRGEGFIQRKISEEEEVSLRNFPRGKGLPGMILRTVRN